MVNNDLSLAWSWCFEVFYVKWHLRWAIYQSTGNLVNLEQFDWAASAALYLSGTFPLLIQLQNVMLRCEKMSEWPCMYPH